MTQEEKSLQPKISKSFFAIFIFLGIVLSIFLNYFVIQNIIIPDPCKYHNADTTKVFQLFYEQTSANGDHPEPTLFNLGFTVVIGVILGVFSAKKLHRKNHSS